VRTGRIDSICREILVLDLHRSDSGGRGRFAWFVSGFRLTFIRLAPKCLHFLEALVTLVMTQMQQDGTLLTGIAE